jgi:two-component system NtrC family sensor kinase
MKKLYSILILFLALNCYAQDTTIVLSQSMFDKAFDYISLGQLNGWRFKTGSDTIWAQKDINTSGWKKLRPVDLSAKYADKNGRVECWFRIKVKPGAGFKDDRPGICYNSWPAAEVYINGKLLSSWGNTGLNRRPYVGYTAANADAPVLIDLKPGAEYVIVLHLVDHLSPMPRARLTINDSTPLFLLILTGPNYNDAIWRDFFDGTATRSTWLCVCATLSLLFWLIAIQNRYEKELRSVAICSTFFALWACFEWLFNGLGLSYTGYLIDGKFLAIAFQLIFISVIFVITGIFKRKISRSFRIVMTIAGISVILADTFLPPAVAGLFLVYDFFLIGVCIYYVIASWKKLHGAQWSIVAGLMASLIFFILVIIDIIATASNSVAPGWLALFFTGFVLSFPLSLLVYVAVRLKLTIKEVRESAQQVMAPSEEKKQEALNRQKILEEEVNRQTAEIRANQARLIQSEKMASLGELTAGVRTRYKTRLIL